MKTKFGPHSSIYIFSRLSVTSYKFSDSNSILHSFQGSHNQSKDYFDKWDNYMLLESIFCITRSSHSHDNHTDTNPANKMQSSHKVILVLPLPLWWHRKYAEKNTYLPVTHLVVVQCRVLTTVYHNIGSIVIQLGRAGKHTSNIHIHICMTDRTSDSQWSTWKVEEFNQPSEFVGWKSDIKFFYAF